MRTVVMVIATACISATGLGAEDPLSRKLSLKWNRTPIKQVLKDLSEKTGLRFVYSETRIAKAGPVSLEIKNQSVSRVLRSVLRARGLEVVLSKQGLAALVDANGDIGSAKSFGRALRTFVRLEKKLEGAKQVRDEVFVPGWTDEDDRRLAEALIDLSNSIFYFGEVRKPAPHDVDQAERMVGSYDSDLRAGTACLLLDGLDRKRGDARVDAIYRKMLADRDPLVRGCAVFSAIGFMRNDPARYARILRKTSKSPHAVERFAAAMANAVQPEFGRACTIRPEVFQADKVAAVRLMGYSALLFGRRGTGKRKPTEAVGKILRDDNPVVRTLGLGLALTDRSAMEGAGGFIKASGDPWLKTCLGMITSTMKGDMNQRFASVKGMMLSEKQSHRLLGCTAVAALMVMPRKRSRGAANEASAKLEVGNVRDLLDSRNLWVRSTALFVCAGLGEPGTSAKVLAALRGDEVDRHLGLICSMPPATKLTPEVRKALLAEGRCVTGHAEAGLLGEILAGKLPPEELCKATIVLVKRDPDSSRLEQLFAASRRLGHKGEAGRNARARIVDAILAANRPELEMRLVRQWGRYYWSRHDSELLFRLLREGHLQTVLELVSRRSLHVFSGAQQDKAFDSVRERLLTAMSSKDEASRCAALRAKAMLIDGVANSFNRGRGERVTALRKMLDVAEKDSPEVAGAGMELLSAALGCDLFRDRQYKRTVPQFLQQDCVAALKLVEHPVAGGRARTLLRQLIDGRTRVPIKGIMTFHRGGFAVNGRPPDVRKLYDAELVKAIAAAQKKVLASKSAQDQVLLRFSLAVTGDPDAVQWLAARCVADKVPADLRTMAMGAAAGQVRVAPGDFTEWLLGRISDPKEDVNFIDVAFKMLVHHQGYEVRLVEAADKLLAGRMPGRSGTRMLQSLASMSKAARKSAREKGKPDPTWFERASALGLRIAGDDAAPSYVRECGAKLAAAALPTRKLERMIEEDKTAELVRKSLADELHEAVPASGLYEKLLPKYDALPMRLRAALASSAAQSPKAPKAEDFVVRALNDVKIPLRHGIPCRDSILHLLKLPASPRLIQTVKALKAKGAFWAGPTLRRIKQGKEPQPIREPKTPEVF